MTRNLIGNGATIVLARDLENSIRGIQGAPPIL
jgi:hypothetical protein